MALWRTRRVGASAFTIIAEDAKTRKGRAVWPIAIGFCFSPQCIALDRSDAESPRLTLTFSQRMPENSRVVSLKGGIG